MFKLILLNCLFQFGFAVTPHPWDAVSKSIDWWMYEDVHSEMLF